MHAQGSRTSETLLMVVLALENGVGSYGTRVAGPRTLAFSSRTIIGCLFDALEDGEVGPQ